MKLSITTGLLGLALAVVAPSASATTTTCNASARTCTAQLGGTASPNHMSVTVSEGRFQISMCDTSSGSCVWRTCSLTDDGSSKYRSMHNTALQAISMNQMNYGRVYMKWDSSNKCVAVTAYGP